MKVRERTQSSPRSAALVQPPSAPAAHGSAEPERSSHLGAAWEPWEQIFNPTDLKHPPCWHHSEKTKATQAIPLAQIRSSVKHCVRSMGCQLLALSPSAFLELEPSVRPWQPTLSAGFGIRMLPEEQMKKWMFLNPSGKLFCSMFAKEPVWCFHCSGCRSQKYFTHLPWIAQDILQISKEEIFITNWSQDYFERILYKGYLKLMELQETRWYLCNCCLSLPAFSSIS